MAGSVTASAFNQLYQHANGLDNKARFYAELTVFVPGNGQETIALLICTYSWKDGQAELTWWLVRTEYVVTRI